MTEQELIDEWQVNRDAAVKNHEFAAVTVAAMDERTTLRQMVDFLEERVSALEARK